MRAKDIALTLFPSPPGEGREKRRLLPFAPGEKGPGDEGKRSALTLFPSPPGEGREKRRPALLPFAPLGEGAGG